MRFQPFLDRILVQRRDTDDVTAGGLIIPDQAKERPNECVVVAVGDGRPDEQGNILPLTVKPGDRVLTGKYAGIEIKVDGQPYLIMREEEIFGFLMPDEPMDYEPNALELGAAARRSGATEPFVDIHLNRETF